MNEVLIMLYLRKEGFQKTDLFSLDEHKCTTEDP